MTESECVPAPLTREHHLSVVTHKFDDLICRHRCWPPRVPLHCRGQSAEIKRIQTHSDRHISRHTKPLGRERERESLCMSMFVIWQVHSTVEWEKIESWKVKFALSKLREKASYTKSLVRESDSNCGAGLILMLTIVDPLTNSQQM